MRLCSSRKATWQLLLAGGFLNLYAGQTTSPPPKAVANSSITVRFDSVGPASERDIIDLERSATAIFRHAGVDATWLNCSGAYAPCGALTRQDRFGPTLVRLRIVDRLDRGGVHRLGWTTQGSWAATVQYRRAEQISHASTSGLSTGQVLGHVAAHEIGHVLLGSSAHGSFGVMKSTYNNEDFLNMVQGRLLFTVEESRGLRARLDYKTVDDNAGDAAP